MVGLLLSENGGVGLTNDGTTLVELLPDSADIFGDGAYYYIFRVVVDNQTGKGNIYITRSDILALTGIHELRYTINLYDTPTTKDEGIVINVVGEAAAPVQVCLDCLRYSSQSLIQNARPVAVPGDDQSTILGQYTSFDGRASYDPEGVTLTQWWWTIKSIPQGAIDRLDGGGTTAADATDYTNVLTASSGTFSDVVIGDVLVYQDTYSHVVYKTDDGTRIELVKDILPEDVYIDWVIVHQRSWGGTRVTGSLVYVLDQITTPPVSPDDGDKYLVIATATGDFAGEEGNTATWVYNIAEVGNGHWNFETLASGAVLYVIADSEAYRTTGSGFWYESEPKAWELDYWEGRTSSVGVYLSSVNGLYYIDLTVSDGVRDSIPVEVLSSVHETGTQLGLTPDLKFVWNYLSDFWSVVSGKEKFETFWSAYCQVISDELMRLWQHDYSKSIVDIQRIFQRRWLHYSLYYEEPDYESLPAVISNAVNESGWATAPNPVQVAGESAPDEARTYVLDIMPATVAANQYLVLDGISYKIIRIDDLSLITLDDMPTGSAKPQNWMIRPTIASVSSDFSDLQVTAGDSAILEIQDTDGAVQELSCHIWGVRKDVLVFDDSSASSYLAESDYTVLFKGVIRKKAIQINDLVVGIPVLQEVIALNRVEGRPDPFYENNDYRIETATTVTEHEVNTIQFLTMWYPEQLSGIAGSTDGVNRNNFYDYSVDFEDTFGAVADLSSYVLVVDDVYYRLSCVVSANKLELYDDCLELSLTNVSWEIRLINSVPDVLWAEVTNLDNKYTIESNFGKLVGFTLDALEERTDDLDYLSAVQGLWYYTWSGRTPYNIEVGCQIILGLPFAEVAGTITDIQSPFDSTRSRLLIQDADNDTIIRSYYYPTEVSVAENPDTGAAYAVGDTVASFAPLSEGVSVIDHVSDANWFQQYASGSDISEVQKYHTYGVVVNSAVFDIVNLIFLIGYLRDRGPRHKSPFFAVLKETNTSIDSEDVYVLGPAVPADVVAGSTYPQDWPVFEIPSSWDDSPWEVTRAVVSNDAITGWTTPRPPWLGFSFGGLRFKDSSGQVPDGWSGSWPSGAPGTHAPTMDQGSFCFDDVDHSGRCIHKVGEIADANNIALDEGFESSDALGDPASPWDLLTGPLAYTISKDLVTVRSDVKSAYISSDGAGYGIEQTFDEAVPDNFQIGCRVWLYIVSDSAHVRLLDRDGTTVLAEKIKQVPQAQWVQITLHAWAVTATGDYPVLQIMTGPAGGDFYVDDVELYHTIMPWGQWTPDRAILGRTGGYTFGGSPDEYWEYMVYLEGTPANVTAHPEIFSTDAGSADDALMLSGPAPSAPPSLGVDPWEGPYGLPVTEWKEATHPGYGTSSNPTKGYIPATVLPSGWYTRIYKKDKQ
ncbi:MAG: DUF2793 domain-containing protein [Candidatus Hodarchaeales archaeon]